MFPLTLRLEGNFMMHVGPSNNDMYTLMVHVNLRDEGNTGDTLIIFSGSFELRVQKENQILHCHFYAVRLIPI